MNLLIFMMLRSHSSHSIHSIYKISASFAYSVSFTAGNSHAPVKNDCLGLYKRIVRAKDSNGEGSQLLVPAEGIVF